MFSGVLFPTASGVHRPHRPFPSPCPFFPSRQRPLTPVMALFLAATPGPRRTGLLELALRLLDILFLVEDLLDTFTLSGFSCKYVSLASREAEFGASVPPTLGVSSAGHFRFF